MARSRRSIASTGVLVIAGPGTAPGTRRARAYRSGAPVELVQRSRVTLPLAQFRIGPSTALAAGQAKVRELKCGLGGGALDLSRISLLVLQGGQCRFADPPDPEEGLLAPAHLDPGGLRGQPVADHGPHQALEEAALFPGKYRL